MTSNGELANHLESHSVMLASLAGTHINDKYAADVADMVSDMKLAAERLRPKRKPGSTEGMSPERAAEFTRRPADGSFSEQEGEWYR